MMVALAKRILPALAFSLAVVALSGVIAIGLSGLLAAGLGHAFGQSFVTADPPDISYTPERCADLLEYHPEAASCEAAAVAHHYDEVVQYRIAAGLLGVLGAGVGWLLYRRFRALILPRQLPDGFTETIGASLFGLATCVLLGQGLLDLASREPASTGAYLSGGIVSLIFFAAYGLALLRSLSQHGSRLEPSWQG